jgi:hypothetical protein
LSSLAIGVLTLATPGYAQVDPANDVLFHPVAAPTAEATLTGQIQATNLAVQGAYSGPNSPPAPPQSSLFADSHTIVLADIYAGGPKQYFSLPKYDSQRQIQGNPVGDLQGVLLYFTVALKNGRQVLDNESSKPINAAIVEIGVGVDVNCYEPVIDSQINWHTNPRVTVTGSLGADPNDGSYVNNTTVGKDYGAPNWFPDVNNLTDAEIDMLSTGADRLAAIIDPTDPGNSFSDQPIYTITDAAQLAAFTGSGDLTFAYSSLPTSAHFSGDQDFAQWTVPPQFDIEARVVYLYTGVPEPATMGLLAIGALGLIRRRRRSWVSRKD